MTGLDQWRELFRCDDLKLARAVATSIAAMEFDVRLCSVNPSAWRDDAEPSGHAGSSMPAEAGAFGARFSPHGCLSLPNRAAACDLPGPHVIEVSAGAWHQLKDVLAEIIDEQREFDQMLEARRQRNRTTLVVVLSITTAAEVVMIWRLLEG
jgi:hypothetical protein